MTGSLYEFAITATLDELLSADWCHTTITTSEQFGMLTQPDQAATLHANHIEARMHLLFVHWATQPGNHTTRPARTRIG